MREQFIKTLTELAEQDPKVVLIVGDVGFSFVDEFEKQFPEQFINAGVTEQSMMGLAAGMALSGWKPYVYSMIPFVTMRCFEQLRNDVCYNKANVKVIGVKGSVHYKFLGFSHNLSDDDEDRAILSKMPNLDQYYPKNKEQVVSFLKASYENTRPTYFRL